MQFHKERIEEQLQRDIGEVITTELRDPRVPPIVTIVKVSVSSDIRNATVGFSIFGNEAEKKSALIALNRAAPYIGRLVAARVRLKRFPKLYFKYDDAVEKATHISHLFSEISDDMV